MGIHDGSQSYETEGEEDKLGISVIETQTDRLLTSPPPHTNPNNRLPTVPKNENNFMLITTDFEDPNDQEVSEALTEGNTFGLQSDIRTLANYSVQNKRQMLTFEIPNAQSAQTRDIHQETRNKQQKSKRPRVLPSDTSKEIVGADSGFYSLENAQ